MNKTAAAAGLLVVALLIVLVLGYQFFLSRSPQPVPGPPQTVPGSPAAGSHSSAASPPIRRGSVWVVGRTADGDQSDLVPQPVVFTHPQSPARDALQALIHAKGSPLPRGIALDGITIRDGLATVDFSRSPLDETAGEGRQSRALDSILRTLGQFPTIDRVQLLAAGQPLRSLGEAGDSSGPLDVVRPDAVQQAQTGEGTGRG